MCIGKKRPFIIKQATHSHKPVSVKEKLAVVLRYLARGETIENLLFQFRLHAGIISQFIEPVCKAFYNALVPEYVKTPLMRKNWITQLKVLRWDGSSQTVALKLLVQQKGSIFQLFHLKNRRSEYLSHKDF